MPEVFGIDNFKGRSKSMYIYILYTFIYYTNSDITEAFLLCSKYGFQQLNFILFLAFLETFANDYLEATYLRGVFKMSKFMKSNYVSHVT